MFGIHGAILFYFLIMFAVYSANNARLYIFCVSKTSRPPQILDRCNFFRNSAFRHLFEITWLIILLLRTYLWRTSTSKIPWRRLWCRTSPSLSFSSSTVVSISANFSLTLDLKPSTLRSFHVTCFIGASKISRSNYKNLVFSIDIELIQ